MSAHYATLSRSVRITGSTQITASSVHLDDDQMHVRLNIAAGFGLDASSYMTVTQSRDLAAALIAVADQYEAVRRPADAVEPPTADNHDAEP